MNITKILIIALTLLLVSVTANAENLKVVAQVPDRDHKIGEVVMVPLNIYSEELEIVSYSVGLRYDPAVLKLVDVMPGLTPRFSKTPMSNSPEGSQEIWITGSATAFGSRQDVLNVANLKFELIAENRIPRFELIETGPLVQLDGFQAVAATYEANGELGLFNFMFDHGFE